MSGVLRVLMPFPMHDFLGSMRVQRAGCPYRAGRPTTEAHMAQVADAGILLALRHLAMAPLFIHGIKFDTLDYLIGDGLVRSAADGEWRLTGRGWRSMRARRAAQAVRTRTADHLRRAA